MGHRYIEKFEYLPDGLATKKAVDFSNSPSVALPSNTTVNGSPISGGGGTSYVVDLVTVYASTINTTPGAALNTAFAAANAIYNATGVVQTLYLAGGTYTIEAGVFVQCLNGVYLKGAGKFSTIIKSNTTLAPFKAIGTTTNYLTDYHMSDMTIDSINQSGAYSDTKKNIFIQYAYRCTFKRLYCKDAYATNFGLDFPYECVVNECDFINGGRGMSGPPYYDGGNGLGCLIGDPTVPFTHTYTLFVQQCNAHGCKDYGFLIEASAGSTASSQVYGCMFSDCFAAGCGMAGFCDAGGYGASFTGCTAYFNPGDGFLIGRGDINSSGIFCTGSAGSIVGCTVHLNSGYGIRYDNVLTIPISRGYKIIGNDISSNGFAGVEVRLASLANSNADEIVISDNVITGNNTATGYAGIHLAALGTATVTNIKVANNQIIDNNVVGMLIDAPVTGGEIDSYFGNSTGTAQATGLSIATGRAVSKVRFGGSYYATTTPVSIVGTIDALCSVEAAVPGWTRGTGAPTIKAPQGTVYQRTDGSTNTNAYVNTDGGTTWVAFA